MVKRAYRMQSKFFLKIYGRRAIWKNSVNAQRCVPLKLQAWHVWSARAFFLVFVPLLSHLEILPYSDYSWSFVVKRVDLIWKHDNKIHGWQVLTSSYYCWKYKVFRIILLWMINHCYYFCPKLEDLQRDWFFNWSSSSKLI